MPDRKRTKDLERAARAARDAFADLLAVLDAINAIADDTERGRALRELMRTKLELVRPPGPAPRPRK